MFMEFDILQSLTLKDKRYKQKAWITSYKTEIEKYGVSRALNLALILRKRWPNNLAFYSSN